MQNLNPSYDYNISYSWNQVQKAETVVHRINQEKGPDGKLQFTTVHLKKQ